MPDAGRFLISDIGGTNIRVASFQSDPRQRESEIIYRLNPETNAPYEVLEALKDYRTKVSGNFSAACLGVAGRVKGDRVQVTNRPDLISRDDVAKVLKLDPSRVMLVNDMPPHLASVDRLLPAEVIEIKLGATDSRGARGVLMPGTGVGVGGAVFVPNKGYILFPSEGGHIDFAPRDEQQDALLRYLRPLAVKLNDVNVSNEVVFCGQGIRRICNFLRDGDVFDMTDIPKPEEITTAVAAGNLPPEDIRVRTINLFLQILGAAAGNLALVLTATGGIYLGGSICLTLRSLLPTPAFTEPFLSSGPANHRPLLEDVPVRLIDYKDSGLLGAGVLALGLV